MALLLLRGALISNSIRCKMDFEISEIIVCGPPARLEVIKDPMRTTHSLISLTPGPRSWSQRAAFVPQLAPCHVLEK